MSSPLYDRAVAVLKRFYGYDTFLPMQFDVISHIMGGDDAIVLMPTGGGKSVCYQIPALLSEGCAIVVSPLLALMKDQVDALLANGIPAAALNSLQTEAQNREIIEQVFAGHIKLLYLSPERLLSDVLQWIGKVRISLIAVDEAHCISQWGHDFRPEYTQLHALREHFEGVPIMALTATADRITRDDIRAQLGMEEARMFITSFDRPNISLNVATGVQGRDKMRMIIRFIERHRGESGIIYCLARKTTEQLAEKLRAAGINAKAFHAAMATNDKIQIQRDFINDDLPIICATIAFGMGIDKSNVRWIIHYNMPKSLEGYYQEVGRAGRDRMPAEALLFYSYNDVVTLTHFAQESGQSEVNIEKLTRMRQFAEATVCRRRILLSYFNERFDHDCGNCDVCLRPPERFDGTTLVQMALSAIARTKQQARFSTIINILRASRRADVIEAGYHNLPTYGVGRHLSFAEWNDYLLQMIQLGIIETAYNEDNHLKITDYGSEILYGKRQVEMAKFHFHETKEKKEKPALISDAELNPDRALFEHLRDVRMALAKASGVAPYMIFSDKVLTVIAAERPLTQAQFSTLYGVGERKTKLYWRPFTAAIHQWLHDHPETIDR